MIVMENDWLRVSIAESGAEVRKVTHMKNGLDYMWTGDKAYWGRVSPVLFPIVGRLKEDRYEINGRIYEMSQHGFLRDVLFEVAEHTKTTATFVFESEGRFTNIYPYEFKAVIRYLLKEDTLTVRWEIVNESQEEMFFSIGAHPAFKIPLLENETSEDYSLNFTSAANQNVVEFELKDSLIHEKETANPISSLKLASSLFANDARIYNNIDQITLESNKSHHGVEVNFKGFPFVGIWSKYMDRDGTIAPFVCIEPWYGIADTYDTTGNLKEKFGINKLKPGQIFEADYEMKFK